MEDIHCFGDKMKTRCLIKKDIITHLNWSAERLLFINNGKDEIMTEILVRDITEVISKIMLSDNSFSIRDCLKLIDELKIEERLKSYNIEFYYK